MPKRLFLNRASGGRLAKLWEHGEESQDHCPTTKEWLPQWILPAAIPNKLQDGTAWIKALWTAPQVLNPSGSHDTSVHEDLSVIRLARAAWRITVASDNILLLTLLLSLGVVVLLRRRRHVHRTSS